MSHSDAARPFALSPVKFSRLTRRGVILGFSLPQVVALAAAVFAFVVALYSGGGVLYCGPVQSGPPAWS